MKILIVDDSRTIRQQVRFTLEKSGYEVIEAENGLDGLEKAKANPDIKAVISDVNMPEMDGLTMVEQIKKDDGTKHLPIMMLTTEGAANLIQRAKAAGAKGWIVKPFTPEKLVQAVGILTGGPK